MRIIEQTGDSGLLAVTYLRFGSLFADFEIHYKAADFLEKALQLGVQINDSDLVSVGAFNYSLILSEEEQYKESIAYAMKSLEYGGNSIPDYDLMIMYAEIAANFLRAGNPEKGRLYLNQADSVMQFIDSEWHYPLYYSYAADYDTLENNHILAIRKARKALELCRKTDNFRGEVTVALQLSKIYADLGVLNFAQQFAERAKDVVFENELGDYHQYMAFKNLSYVLSLRGKKKQAHQYLTMAHDALMKMRTSGKSKAAMMADLEQSQKQNKLLAKEKQLMAKEQEIERAAIEQQQTKLIWISTLSVIFFAVMILLFYLYWKSNRLLELKRNIISAAGHDIKSPVAQLESTLDIMTMDIDDKETLQTLLPGVRQNLKKASGSIDAILDWARDSMLKEKAPADNVMVQEVIDQCLTYVDHSAQVKGLKIIKNTNEDYTMKGNKDQLAIVLRNLLSNAVKFSPPGGEVKIDTCKKDNRIFVSVSDNGPGIPENIQKYLFRIPLKSSNGTRPKAGHGLGLYLSNIFAKKGNGKLTFVSKPGEGTTFTVGFPAA